MNRTKSSRLGFVLSMMLLASCAPDGGTPAAPVDLVPSSLTANGCLDLASALAQVRTMSANVTVRTSTPLVDILGDNLRRNFVGESAFSNYRFEEVPATVAAAAIPEVTQTGCESVSMKNGPGGERLYKVSVGEDPALLILDAEDGSHMEWKVTSSRSIEVRSEKPIMDRCPQYDRAKARTVTEYRWGTGDELAAQQVTVSRSMLRAISTVVRDMPAALLRLATFDPNDTVVAKASDLKRLVKASLDPETQICPYRAEPPASAEPPPPPPGSTLPFS